MSKKEIHTTVFEFTDTKNLLPKEKELVDSAIQIAGNAYAIYSDFYVGAAVLLDNGTIIKGNNQENAAYPSGLCAERVALFYANANYPDRKVVAIAISAFRNKLMLENPVPPCGSCRQALLETALRFNNSIKVILIGKKKIQVINDCRELLPLHFDQRFINNKTS
ncbi:MAG: cytidine deaminase [Bacteroidota bacterium]